MDAPARCRASRPSLGSTRPAATGPLVVSLLLAVVIRLDLTDGFSADELFGRIFRNEGAYSTHNPEFTMLEAYEAYGDYDTMATLTRELLQSAARAALGGTIVRRPDGTEYDIGGSWPSVTVHEAISAALGEPVTPDTGLPALVELCSKADVPLQPSWNRGQVILEMYERLVEKQTVAPTFYRDFPV